MILRKIKDKWQSLRFYVIADPKDNSITLSKHLFRHITHNADGTNASVFVFQIPGREPKEKRYGFAVNHGLKHEETQLCDIQYNDKLKCIGFETLCPSVGTIFYDYGLPSDKCVKLSVSVHRAQSLLYYQLHKPNAKILTRYDKGTKV